MSYFFLKMNKKIISISFITTALLFPLSAFAAVCDSTVPAAWFNCVANNLLNIVVWPIFFALSVIMFIVAGFLYLTARGEPGKIQTANKAVIWAIVGIAIAIAGFSATTIINNILGV